METKDFKRVVYETVDGQKRAATFKLLKGRRGGWVYSKTVSVVLESLIGLWMAKQSPKQALSALKSLDFDDVIWPLAKNLLESCSIDYNAERPGDCFVIERLEDTAFFDDNWDELYLLIWHGIQANYPKSLARLRAKLEGLGLDLDKVKDMVLGAPSKVGKQTSTPSPSGTE